MICIVYLALIFFFNDTATTEIYTLSLHDALPIWILKAASDLAWGPPMLALLLGTHRSEEHTSELQSLTNLVCRLLLEKIKMSDSGFLRALPPPKRSTCGFTLV